MQHVWRGRIVQVVRILITDKFKDRVPVHLAMATVMRVLIRKAIVIVRVLHRMFRMRRRSADAYIQMARMHVMRRGVQAGTVYNQAVA